MRIAFIMLCHKNPEQINLLIKKLSEFTDSDIYIHVDKKYSEIKESLYEQKNVVVLPLLSSYQIDWGSIAVVKATLQLIRAVKESRKQYDYVWLVSGQDYPIVSAREIEERLSVHPEMNYIQTIVQGDNRYNWYKKLCEIAYPTWISKDNFAIKAIKHLLKIFTGGYQHTFECFVRKKPFPCEFVFGSQWWTLTAKAAYELLEYSDAHPEILNYYKKSIIPDESFFQTLFLRGPYGNQRAMSLTYVKWGENHRHPEVLTSEDLDLLQKKSCEFCLARKIELPQSNELIKQINTLLLDISPKEKVMQ